MPHQTAVPPAPRQGGTLRRIKKALCHRYEVALRKLSPTRNAEVELVAHSTELPAGREVHAVLGRRTKMMAPRLFDLGLEEIRLAALDESGPDLQLLELRSATVVGGSMGVIQQGKLLHPELLHTKATHEDKAPDICQFADARRQRVRVRGFSRRWRPPVAVGVHLLKEHAQNYYHWMFECLPRLVFFREHWKRLGVGKVTLLIEHDLLPQLREALQLLLNFPCEIQTVRRGEFVSCDQLYYVSPFWYSLDNSENRVEPQRDYVVDQQAVQMMRAAFQELRSKSPATRKIYVPRLAGQYRKIVNTAEFESVMRQYGYEFVYPHLLTFRQQVELFSQARVIIGASGAAFSNLTFMQAGTQAVIISPKELEHFNYYIFQQQADVAGVELSHLLAAQVTEKAYHVHHDFRVNCQDLEQLVQRLG